MEVQLRADLRPYLGRNDERRLAGASRDGCGQDRKEQTGAHHGVCPELRTPMLSKRSDLLAVADIGITDQIGACFFDRRYPEPGAFAAVCLLQRVSRHETSNGLLRGGTASAGPPTRR